MQPADLTKANEVRKVGDFIRSTLGRLDILVNNAGVNIVERHWDKLTPESIDTLLQGNLTRRFVLCYGRFAVHARAKRWVADPYGLDGRAVHRRSQRANLYGGQAWDRGDEFMD